MKDILIQSVKDEDLLPATLSKEITTDLLRGKLGFNGVVVTDASHMLGLTGAMKRSELLPTSIAAGCDLFLFFNDPDEDFGSMMDGYKEWNYYGRTSTRSFRTYFRFESKA